MFLSTFSNDLLACRNAVVSAVGGAKEQGASPTDAAPPRGDEQMTAPP